MQLIDSHTHIDFSDFDADRDETIKRAVAVNVQHIIVSSTTAERWKFVTDVVSINPSICHAAYGLHPMFMAEHQDTHLHKLRILLKQERAIAVGEIGLDFFIPEPNKEKQLALFSAQLEIADEFKLPVIVHARKSLDLILKQLRLYPRLRGSIHSFSGSEQQAEQLIELGFYLSFGGPVTYTRATRLRGLLKKLPLDSLLLETDSPDQPDALHYGKRNEPAYLLNIAKEIASIRGIGLKELASLTTSNAKKLFQI